MDDWTLHDIHFPFFSFFLFLSFHLLSVSILLFLYIISLISLFSCFSFPPNFTHFLHSSTVSQESLKLLSQSDTILLDPKELSHGDNKQHHTKKSQHVQYATHFPIPFECGTPHDLNQRLILLYGVGKSRTEAINKSKEITNVLIKMLRDLASKYRHFCDIFQQYYVIFAESMIVRSVKSNVSQEDQHQWLFMQQCWQKIMSSNTSCRN